jgi:hypothetical protein
MAGNAVVNNLASMHTYQYKGKFQLGMLQQRLNNCYNIVTALLHNTAITS